MSQCCDRCGKGSLRGKKIARIRQELNSRSPKVFKANLHPFKAMVSGRKKKLTLCTKCLRRVKKEQEEQRTKEAALKVKAEEKKKKKITKSKKRLRKVKISRKEARAKRQEKKEAQEKKRGRKTKSS